MRNKSSVTLNVETEEGRKILKDLAVHADVIIENAPPGQWDERGIGYRQLRELNPRLIYCWVGQRGQWGPLKDKPGMLDPMAQSACGFVHGTGDPKEFGGQPTRSALWMADHVGGSAAAMGILAALLYRENVSGRRPVRRGDFRGGHHPDPGLQLGVVLDGRQHSSALRQLGPGHQYLRGEPMQGRLHDGGRWP